ncbi:unnamed protein product, partial [Ectocarpus sp. 8 AP-2014]
MLGLARVCFGMLLIVTQAEGGVRMRKGVRRNAIWDHRETRTIPTLVPSRRALRPRGGHQPEYRGHSGPVKDFCLSGARPSSNIVGMSTSFGGGREKHPQTNVRSASLLRPIRENQGFVGTVSIRRSRG